MYLYFNLLQTQVGLGSIKIRGLSSIGEANKGVNTSVESKEVLLLLFFHASAVFKYIKRVIIFPKELQNVQYKTRQNDGRCQNNNLKQLGGDTDSLTK